MDGPFTGTEQTKMTKVVSNKKQLARLVQLMEENLDIAKGICSKTASQKKWHEFAMELNILGPPTREWDKWQRVWTDIKCKTKKKKTENKIEISATGGGPNRLRSFNNLEESVIRMLEIETCVNPPGLEFGSEEIILNDVINVPNTEVTTVPNTVQTNLQTTHLEPEDFLQRIPRKASRMEKLQTERKTLLEAQTSSQKDFHESMTNLMGDIRKSMKNIEYYIKKDVRQKEEILKIKKEKLRAYKENKENKDKDRKAKLKLKIAILEIKQKKQNIMESY